MVKTSPPVALLACVWRSKGAPGVLEPPEDLWELPLEARSGVTDLKGELYYVLSDGFVSRKGFCEGFYCTGLWCSYSNTVFILLLLLVLFSWEGWKSHASHSVFVIFSEAGTPVEQKMGLEFGLNAMEQWGREPEAEHGTAVFLFSYLDRYSGTDFLSCLTEGLVWKFNPF